MKLVVETVPDFAIFLMEPNATIRTWNEGVKKVFGYDEDEWIGRNGDIIFTEADRKAGALQNALAAAIELGRANNERWHQRKDGTILWEADLPVPCLTRKAT